MGNLQAQEMTEMADLDTALAWHLTANHYPPVPAYMLETCKQAIDLANEGDWHSEIELPEGVLYKGLTEAPVYAIVEQHHLSNWIEEED